MLGKSDNLGDAERGVEGDVGEDVDNHHQDYRDRNPWSVSVSVNVQCSGQC